EIAVELEIGEDEEIGPERLAVVTNLAKHLVRGAGTKGPPRGARDVAAERAPAPTATAPRQDGNDLLRIPLPGEIAEVGERDVVEARERSCDRAAIPAEAVARHDAFDLRRIVVLEERLDDPRKLELHLAGDERGEPLDSDPLAEHFGLGEVRSADEHGNATAASDPAQRLDELPVHEIGADEDDVRSEALELLLERASHDRGLPRQGRSRALSEPRAERAHDARGALRAREIDPFSDEVASRRPRLSRHASDAGRERAEHLDCESRSPRDRNQVPDRERRIPREVVEIHDEDSCLRSRDHVESPHVTRAPPLGAAWTPWLDHQIDHRPPARRRNDGIAARTALTDPSLLESRPAARGPPCRTPLLPAAEGASYRTRVPGAEAPQALTPSRKKRSPTGKHARKTSAQRAFPQR